MTPIQTAKHVLRRTWFYTVRERARAYRKLLMWSAEDEQMLTFYSRFIGPGSLCFDVGANIGSRVRVFLRLGAAVVAVEPQPECVRILTRTFGKVERFQLVAAALGASEGEAEMLVSEASTLSSLSPRWINTVRQSGRFSNYARAKKICVPVTTLDRLIQQNGAPAFIKIDVEGFEHEVLRGLTRPVQCLSFEFTPEFLDAAIGSIEHLKGLGEICLNYSLGESARLALDGWVGAAEMEGTLSRFRADTSVVGDVYVRYKHETGKQYGAKG